MSNKKANILASRMLRVVRTADLARNTALHRSIHVSAVRFNQKFDEADMFSDRLTKQEYFAKREPSGSSEEEINQFKRTEAMQGLITGALGVVGLIVGFTVYQKWPNIKSWYNSSEYDTEVPKPKKKRFELPTIKNENDSSVPGLYTFGDNSNGLVNSSKSVKEQRFPLRFDWFDGKILKDVQLGESSAFAIDSKGDLIQWGKSFNESSTVPQYTVKGEGLKLAKLTNGVIYALNKKNQVLLIPESLKDQEKYPVPSRRWFRGRKSRYSTLSLSLLNKKENIIDIQAGKNHLIILTDEWKTYTTATGFSQDNIKSVGQFGLPEYSQFAKTSPPINTLFEITLLNNEIVKNSQNKVEQIEPRFIKQIATGNYHSIALDSNGEVFTFGLNTYGQLGQPVCYNTEIIPFPKRITLFSKYIKRDQFAQVKEIHAGGDTSFCKIHPIQMFKLIKRGQTFQDVQDSEILENEFIVGFGNNLKGQIGNGHYVHAQFDPIKINELSKIKDFNESTNQLEKVEVSDWSSGSEHSFIKLANSDVLYWGSNDFGQLGNGKKNRIAKPENAPALIEPTFTRQMYKDLTFANRLQLKSNQKIIAGENASAIYYTS